MDKIVASTIYRDKFSYASVDHLVSKGVDLAQLEKMIDHLLRKYPRREDHFVFYENETLYILLVGFYRYAEDMDHPEPLLDNDLLKEMIINVYHRSK